MKKLISLTLVLLMLALALSSCADKYEQELRLGLGIYSTHTVKPATGGTNDSLQVVSTAAAVLLDRKDRIVKCEIDCADSTLSFTADGNLNQTDGFMTKGELGDAYGMKAYAGAPLEWYEQVDALEKLVIGKTFDHLALLLAEDGYNGTDDVKNSGCTIGISDFVKALEKAVKKAESSPAKYNDELAITFSSKASSEGANSAFAYESIVSAGAVSEDGKISAITLDSVSIAAERTAEGKVDGIDATKLSQSAKERKDATPLVTAEVDSLGKAKDSLDLYDKSILAAVQKLFK